MTEKTGKSTPKGQGDKTPPKNETDPQKTGEETKGKEIDPIPYPKFSETLKRAKKAEADLLTLQKANEKKENAKLEKANKFKTLYEKEQEKTKGLETKLGEMNMKGQFIQKAQAKGIVDPEVAWSIADKSKMEVGDDGSISGMNEQLDGIVEAKPYLVGEKKTTFGSSATPPAHAKGDAAPTTFKRSQLKDQDFYDKNAEEIEKAAKEGRIEDDISNP